jgi:hypothetical protein
MLPHPETYRGALVYRQENGYTVITITVTLREHETSQVTTYDSHLPIAEEAEHLPNIDLYYFAATPGTRIQLLIASPTGTQEAWYSVTGEEVIAEKSPALPLCLDIVRSSESRPTPRSQAIPDIAQNWQQGAKP